MLCLLPPMPKGYLSYCSTNKVHVATMAPSSAYCEYYTKQYGGELPVFRGGQHGAGLGDILRSVWRWIAPIALRGLSAFTSKTMEAHEKGASLKDAAKSAIGPSLGAMAQSFAANMQPAQQTGSGHDALFSGVQGLPYHGAGGYKGHSHKGKKPKKRAKSHKRTADILREPPPGYNF